MHKSFCFMKRRAQHSRAAFDRWCLHEQASLVEHLPELRGYTASIEARGDENDFDAVGEYWFADAASATAAWQSPAGQRLDEETRGHAARVERVQVTAHEFLNTGPDSRFKLFAALKRRTDMTRQEFASWWLERHAPLVVVFPELQRYCVNIVTDPTEQFVDGIAEVAFASLESLVRVITSAQVKAVQSDSQEHTSARHRLLAQETRIVALS